MADKEVDMATATESTPGTEHAKHEYNVHEAKTHLSKILEEVEAGEEVVLSRAGKPVAKVTALPPQQRTPGLLKGQIWMADDWDSDEVNEQIARDFGAID